ncbi:MAG: antibiotic biosynthesis monooxygenase [Candidatus Methanoperedens sp.]|nr:antibiotic biosynthesis monooxygenase [Candidatus Methanoperedens sp.]MCZ7369489.1 antibiotic biosynthesis monooxygenase [Candidatus Methanoperedens sp.]
MAYLLVRHKVKDFSRWKPVFDEHAATRKAGGSTGGRLFRSADNPDEVIIIFEWESIEKAKKFAQSEDLRKTMQRAGVNDKPDVYFLEEVERVSV